jgi:hypothetical protein
VHLYWDRREPDVPEGWTPNVPAKLLKLSEMTSDNKYGRISHSVWSIPHKNFADWAGCSRNWIHFAGRDTLIGPRLKIGRMSLVVSFSLEKPRVLSSLVPFLPRLAFALNTTLYSLVARRAAAYR